jgi:hypothetical protein
VYAYQASIFEEILIFSATTCTKKNGSVATLGTLGAKKSKFTKKNLTAKNNNCRFPNFKTSNLSGKSATSLVLVKIKDKIYNKTNLSKQGK